MARRDHTPVLIKAGIVALGYFVAVSVAVIVTEAPIIVPMALPDGGARGSLLAFLGDLPVMLAVGFVWTFACALPGFLLAIFLGERSRWNHWLVYAAAGGINAVPSLTIFSLLAGSPLGVPEIIPYSVLGGVAGGAAYWMSAGRYMARHRSAPPAAIPAASS